MPDVPPSPSPLVLLVRHGETALNLGRERIRGWQNVPLDPKGQATVRKLAPAIATYNPRVLFSSDLLRAIETAQIIRQALPTPAPILPSPAFRPWDVGRYTGQPVDAIKDKLQALLVDKATPAPGGESYLTFAERFLSALSQLFLFAQAAPFPIALITHSRNVRVVRALFEHGVNGVLHEPPGKVLLRDEDPIAPGGFAVLRWEGHEWKWGDEHDHPPSSGTAPTGPTQAGLSVE
jgi:probable phosphoglycerate mutase